MARQLRIEYPGAFYHITSRGNDRKRIFYGKADYKKFLTYIKQAKEKYGCLLHCYVLMSNHYHFVVETPICNLSKFMQYINGSYSKYINKKKKRSGHLFQGRYKSILIDKDRYLLELSRYIHLNPVRAKMVKRPEEYHFSSYNSYITKKEDHLVYHDLILDMISENKDTAKYRYKIFVEMGIKSGPENPIKNIYAGMISGDSSFIKKTLDKLKMEKLDPQETSHIKELKEMYTLAGILNSICDYYGVRRDEILGINKITKQYRNIAIYLIKKYTAYTNKDLGKKFGNLSYSAISKTYHRFMIKLKNDQKLEKDIRVIMSNVNT